MPGADRMAVLKCLKEWEADHREKQGKTHEDLGDSEFTQVDLAQQGSPSRG